MILPPEVEDEWPEEFWEAFEGMPLDLERPIAAPQQRDDVESELPDLDGSG